jgi:hypothetical protein
VGLEPGEDSVVTADYDCGCDFCQGWRAALALQVIVGDCLDLASIDADLQRMVLAWSGLPEAIRRAVTALFGSPNEL